MSCFFFKRDIVVVYIYPVILAKHHTFAQRFAAGYAKTRPHISHRLLVVSNGGEPSQAMKKTFANFDPVWMVHDNSGWDIGAYQRAAREFPCDLMVYLGNSVYLKRSGWLDRMVESTERHGLALYGAMGNRGNAGLRIYPHIRTTGFWTHPELMNHYPRRITLPQMRYEFEHGKTSFCGWVRSQGLKAWVVTFKGEYDFPDWDRTGNGYHQGDQSGLLCGDRLTEPPFYRTP